MTLALLLAGGCTGHQFGGPMVVPGRYLGSSGGVSTFEAVPLGDSGFRYLLAMNVGVATGTGTGSPGAALELFMEANLGRTSGFGGRFGFLMESVTREGRGPQGFGGLGPTLLAYTGLGPVRAYAGLGWFPLFGSTTLSGDARRDSSAVRPLIGLRFPWFRVWRWSYVVALEGGYLVGYGDGDVYSGSASLLASGIVVW